MCMLSMLFLMIDINIHTYIYMRLCVYKYITYKYCAPWLVFLRAPLCMIVDMRFASIMTSTLLLTGGKHYPFIETYPKSYSNSALYTLTNKNVLLSKVYAYYVVTVWLIIHTLKRTSTIRWYIHTQASKLNHK